MNVERIGFESRWSVPFCPVLTEDIWLSELCYIIEFVICVLGGRLNIIFFWCYVYFSWYILDPFVLSEIKTDRKKAFKFN